jgi:phage major head subunit gpT-like protein
MEIANIDLVFRKADIRFSKVLQAAQQFAQPNGITEIVPMSTLEMDFYWNARIPAMREWIGPRVIESISTHKTRLIGKPWEKSFGLLREHVEYDQYNLLNQYVTMLGDLAAKHIDYQTADFLLKNPATIGGQSTSYDGKALFASDHPTSGGDVYTDLPLSVPATQSNIGLTTGTTVGTDYWALGHSTYTAARAQMMSLIGEDGKPLNIKPNVLVVPPQLERIGKDILESDLIANAPVNIAVAGGGQNIVLPQRNTYVNTAKLVVVPELSTAPQSWFLMDTSKAIKPLMWGQVKAPEFSFRVNPLDPSVWDNREFKYGVDSYGALGATLWFLSFYGTGGATYGT